MRMPLSPGSQRWAYKGHPGLFRPVQFVVVVHPIELVVASAMIGGHHKAGVFPAMVGSSHTHLSGVPL